jgi:hypothetical protein
LIRVEAQDFSSFIDDDLGVPGPLACVNGYSPGEDVDVMFSTDSTMRGAAATSLTRLKMHADLYWWVREP